MTATVEPPRPLRLLVESSVVGFAAMLLASRVWGMWSRAGFTTPFAIGGDALWHESLVSTMQRHGWYVSDPDLGWPVGRDLTDFPLGTDHLHLVLLKLISLLGFSPSTVVNVFFLLTFVLIAGGTHAVLRAIGLERTTSAVAAVLFAFLQYHVFRGTGHLFLSNYAAVPLLLLLLHRLVRGELLHRGMSKGAIAGTLACVVVLGSASPYYATFAALLLLVGGLAEAARRREKAPALAALAVVVAIGAVFVLNVLPTVVNDLAHGANAEPAGRSASDADTFGIRLSTLIGPVNHRFAPLQHLGQSLFRVSEPGEGGTYLGVFAAAGVAALLGLAFLRAAGRRTDHGPLVGLLSMLTVVTMLLATKGGGSLLLANLGAAQIRGWNRMVVVLALFGLTAAALLFDRRVRPRLDRRWATAILAAVLVVGLWDQIPRGVRGDVAGIQASLADARVFVAGMESSLPEGAAVYQLPYMRFPGSPVVVELQDYEHLMLPVVGSGRLRWGYGAMRGRGGDWQDALVGLEPRDLEVALRAAGFDALEVNGRGYADGCYSFGLALGPTDGANGPYCWWDLRDIEVALDPAEAAEVSAGLTRPAQLAWRSGMERGEFGTEPSTRLLGPDVTLEIRNVDGEPRDVRLVGLIDVPDGSTVTVETGGRTRELDPAGFAVELTVPPGRTELHVHIEGARVSAAGDTRDLRGRAIGWVLTDRRADPLWDLLGIPEAQVGRP